MAPTLRSAVLSAIMGFALCAGLVVGSRELKQEAMMGDNMPGMPMASGPSQDIGQSYRRSSAWGMLGPSSPTSGEPSSPAVAPSAELVTLMSDTNSAMMAVKPCSNADRFFAESMIPHHQGAVKMAQWELQYGSNAQLLNISRDIITSQTQEIAQMQQYLTQLPMPADCAPAPSMDMSMPGASMSSSAALTPSESAMMASMDGMMAPSSPFSGSPDHDFAIEMSSHHQAAIDMAKVELQYGVFRPLLTLADEIIAAQTAQITQFRSILSQNYETALAAAGGR